MKQRNLGSAGYEYREFNNLGGAKNMGIQIFIALVPKFQ